uniref:Uncharacterized protein n=1 Tax=Rhizophora mucronata TaxID=61149 RepID=A0A2P2NR33_RHIMU
MDEWLSLPFFLGSSCHFFLHKTSVPFPVELDT